jgi:hypothetical protein
VCGGGTLSKVTKDKVSDIMPKRNALSWFGFWNRKKKKKERTTSELRRAWKLVSRKVVTLVL